jgi:hypothetical protein
MSASASNAQFINANFNIIIVAFSIITAKYLPDTLGPIDLSTNYIASQG